MRTNKELLHIFLDNTELFGTGLCHWIAALNDLGEITYEEALHLTNIVYDNKTDEIHKRLKTSAYYWEVGNINPRINFLKEHLK